MSRMIRCIEGHVFDAEKSDKCPTCGWQAPPKGASQDKPPPQKQAASLGQVLGAAFNSLTALVDRLLGAAGIAVRPGVSTGIVCAVAILLCVSLGYAVPGMLFGPSGRDGNSRVAPRSEETTPKAPDKEAALPKDNNTPKGNPQNQQSANPPQPNPRPDPSQNDRQQSSHLNDQYEVGGEGRTGFGAIAYSPSARSWGEAYAYGSRNATERRAMAECKEKDCRIVASFYRQCGAVVDDENGVFGVALGATPQLALRDAFAACAANGGKDCEIERVTCTR